MGVVREFDLPTPSATEALGRRLGQLLFGGSVVALVGPLGAGKTFFVRAVAEGLGIADSRIVTSPTFILIQEYPARLPVYHFDTYRLKSVRDFVDLGVDEYFEGDGVCLIEWADRVEAALPPERLTVRLQVTGATSRKAIIEAIGRRYEDLLERLTAAADETAEAD